jgi:hypothetical protein
LEHQASKDQQKHDPKRAGFPALFCLSNGARQPLCSAPFAEQSG